MKTSVMIRKQFIRTVADAKLAASPELHDKIVFAYAFHFGEEIQKVVDGQFCLSCMCKDPEKCSHYIRHLIDDILTSETEAAL